MSHPFRFGVVAAYAPSHTAWITTARKAREEAFAEFAHIPRWMESGGASHCYLIAI